MFKFVIKIFKDKSTDTNNNIEETSLNNILEEIIDNSIVSNPIIKYHEQHSWYDKGKPFSSGSDGLATVHLTCTAKKIKKECKLSSLHIANEWNSIKKCKVEFDVSEYEKVYLQNKFFEVRTEFIAIKEKYNNISEQETRVIEESYLDTFKTISEILKESNYYIDQDEYNLIMDIINQFNKDIEIEREDSKKSRIERLKMEVDYLNKIKETRQMFEKMSNA